MNRVPVWLIAIIGMVLGAAPRAPLPALAETSSYLHRSQKWPQIGDFLRTGDPPNQARMKATGGQLSSEGLSGDVIALASLSSAQPFRHRRMTESASARISGAECYGRFVERVAETFYSRFLLWR
jgi:hypothetical protein